MTDPQDPSLMPSVSSCARTTRILAAASLVWVFSPLAVLSDTPPIARYFIVISFESWLPFVIAYLLIFRRMRGRALRGGFTLALGVGPLVFFAGVLTLVPAAVLINAVSEVPRRVLAIPALLPLLQIPLTLAAIKGYWLLGSERGQWKTLAAGVGTATLCFLIGFALPTFSFTHRPVAAAGCYRPGRDSGDRPVCRDLPHR